MTEPTRTYHSASFVAPGPQLPTVAAPRVADIDANAAVHQALRANGELVAGLLRSIAPDAGAVEGEVIGAYSTPAESAGRTSRYKFSIVAIVAIAATIAGGIMLMAWRGGTVDGPMGLAMWLALTGVISSGFVTWLQRQDFDHSAEGIARLREGYRSVTDQTDAESRGAIAQAVAYSIRVQADSAARTADATARALDAEVARLALPAPVKGRGAAITFDPVQAWSDGAHDGRAAARVQTPEPLTPDPRPLPIPPDATRETMLRWVAELYRVDGAGELVNVDPVTRLIKIRAPWSQRGELSDAEKARVRAALARLTPPLFALTAGNQLALGSYSKLMALAAVRGVLL